MKKNINHVWILIISIIFYFLLKYFIPYWDCIIYPINLLVTFLHEFWHAFFAIITWWNVKSIQINSNWSWFAITLWWISSIILIWWYIWSAIFWNILLYTWFKKKKIAKKIIYFLAWLMIFSWIIWFNSIFSSLLLFFLSGILIFLSRKTNYDSVILQFLWLTSLLYVIEDFNVWPSSDISKFADLFIFIPEFVWMIIWLIIVIIISCFNLKKIMR